MIGIAAAVAGLAEGREEVDARAIRATASALSKFVELVLEANRSVNLVSRRCGTEELVGKHLLDALDGLPFLPPPKQAGRLCLIDIGSGGGFPAVPLLLLRRDIDGLLVESTGRKARALAGFCRELELTATVANARFPDPSFMRENRRFDVLTSRAVARAGLLVRRARPLLARGARALLWTTEPLFPEIYRESGMHRGDFHRSGAADRRGIAVLQGFT